MRILNLHAVALIFVLTACSHLRINGQPVGSAPSAQEPTRQSQAPVSDQRTSTPATNSVHAQRGLPAPPPRTGKTKGCPSQRVLSRRFSFQNDRNGGGYGYYMVRVARNRQLEVISPSRRWADKYARHNLRRPNRRSPLPSAGVLDDKLRFLWGTYCAYSSLPHVEALLEKARALYVRQSGMSLAAEARYHKAMINVTAARGATKQLCAAKGRGTKRMVAAVVCGEHHRHVVARAFKALDRGTKSPLYAAAVLAACRNVRYHYANYRFCTLERASAPPKAVRRALASSELPLPVREKFFARYTMGVARLNTLSSRAAEYERRFPMHKRMVDDAIKQARTKYAPLLAKHRVALDALAKSYRNFSKGPGYARGCHESLEARLVKYIARATRSRHEEAVLAAMRDPIGYQLAGTLALCYRAQGDSARYRMLRGQLLPGATLVTNVYDAAWDILSRLKYKPAYRARMFALQDRLHARSKTHLPEPLRTPRHRWARFSSGGQTSYRGTVASVRSKGAHVVVRFKRTTGVNEYTYGCKTDWRTPIRVDRWGNISYRQYGCRTGRKSIDTTPSPALLTRRDARGIRPGTVIRVSVKMGIRRRNVPRRAVLMWIERGKRVLRVAGLGR